MKWGAKKRRAKRAKIEAKETTEMMRDFTTEELRWMELINYSADERKVYCPACDAKRCEHRNAFRRMPRAVGGLGLCPHIRDDIRSNDDLMY